MTQARLTAEEAARRLGVKRETLYAYVSRGVLTRHRGPDGRTSTFDRAEVERLARRGRPRRSTHGPVIDVTVHSAITRIERGRLLFRGADAIALASTVAFEQVAELLWSGALGPFQRWPAPIDVGVPAGGWLMDRLRVAAALAALTAPGPMRRADATALVDAARRTIATMVAASGPVHHDRTPRLHLGGDAPHSLRDTTAGRLAIRLSTRRPGPELVAAINTALALLADHELAVSTLAARVAASARADGFGIVGAGLGPLSGPLHGTHSRVVRVMLDDAQAHGAAAAIRRASEGGRVPGFGHFLYPQGDPRAAALLARVRALPAPARLISVVDEIATLVADAHDVAPNVDYAVAALGHVSGMAPDAGDAVFAIARSAGWIAHAIEELRERPVRYRTRAVPPRP